MASSQEPPPPEWSYHPSEELDLSLIERMRHYPREPEMLVYALRTVAALALRAWLKTYHRLRHRGLEHLPQEGSFILVCNHTSHLDTLCLLSALPLGVLHRAFPAAAADFFFVDVARSLFSATLLNAIPFHRKGGGAHSLALCRGLLENPGNILILFPEGTRTANGELGPFKPGIGLLAAGSGVPVVPCHLRGGFRAWPKKRWFPFPGRLDLIIGQPRSYLHSPNTREGAQSVAEDLRQAVLALAEDIHP